MDGIVTLQESDSLQDVLNHLDNTTGEVDFVSGPEGEVVFNDFVLCVVTNGVMSPRFGFQGDPASIVVCVDGCVNGGTPVLYALCSMLPPGRTRNSCFALIENGGVPAACKFVSGLL